MIDFSISEFLVDDSIIIPTKVADKIIKHHIAIAQPIRERLGFAIWASQKSGYRPQYWEIKQGRSGTSEHCFFFLGAVDWTAGSKSKIEKLWKELKLSKYKRVCYYPEKGFIHADHKGDEKVNFICDSTTKYKWKRIN